jgi:hypothetical protein
MSGLICGDSVKRVPVYQPKPIGGNMGKLIFTENGITTVRNFSHIVQGFPDGRLGRPVSFSGTLNLSTGKQNRQLIVERAAPNWSSPPQDFWSKVLLAVLFIVFGMALHRSWPSFVTLLYWMSH